MPGGAVTAILAQRPKTGIPAVFVQKIGTRGSSSASSLKVTTTEAALVGQTIFLCIGFLALVSVSSVTDSAGNTWHRDAHITDCELWRAYVTTELPSGGHITVTMSGATSINATAGTWTGISSTGPTATNVGTGASTVHTISVSLTAGHSTDIWISAIWTASNTALSSLVMTQRCNGAPTRGATALGDWSPGTVGPHTVTWTWSSNGNHGCCVASYA